MDRSGSFVAGNVTSVPAFRGWRILKESDLERVSGRSNPEDLYYARWAPLPDGTLLVADERQGSPRRPVDAAGGVALGAGCACHFGRPRRARLSPGARKSRSIPSPATLAAVANGKLGQRVARRYTRDDLDRVAEQINGTLDHLQRLIARVDQASTDIAHDLKRPIGRLRQKLDVALRTATGVSEFRRSIIASLEELDGIVDTFEALLRIAQIETGTRRERFRLVDLKSLLTEVADIYGPVADDAGDELVVEVSNSDASTVNGDSELLIQLFVNLIENAIRHCPPGTTIRVALESGAMSGPRVVVADNGPGIPADQREKVFHRLYRLEKSRSTPGSGLGLSLVAAIAELHGARVNLEDENPGLLVQIDFPRLQAARGG